MNASSCLCMNEERQVVVCYQLRRRILTNASSTAKEGGDCVVLPSHCTEHTTSSSLRSSWFAPIHCPGTTPHVRRHRTLRFGSATTMTNADTVDATTKTTAVSFTETCFCHGKLGHKLWPSGMVLSLVLVAAATAASPEVSPSHDTTTTSTNTEDMTWMLQNLTSLLRSYCGGGGGGGVRTVELGAGVGLPSCVARQVAHAQHVTATDFWQDHNDPVTTTTTTTRTMDHHNRYVPTVEHGQNLASNVSQAGTTINNETTNDATPTRTTCTVTRLDWRHDNHNTMAALFQPANLLLGSDLLYDAPDIRPLWKTLVRFLRSSRPKKQQQQVHNPRDNESEQNDDTSKDGSTTTGSSSTSSNKNDASSPLPHCPTKHIVLVSPLRPDVREDLPAFLKLLYDKAETYHYKVVTHKLQLEVTVIGDNDKDDKSSSSSKDDDDDEPQVFLIIYVVNQ